MDQLEEVDFEELETRLYSQVFHGSNENEESTIINRDLGYEKSNPKRYRYFESEIPVDDTVDMSGKHFKNNVMVTPNSATIFTDSSCGHVVQNNITVNQYTLPVEDFLPTIGYNNHVALPNYHKRSGSNKLYQRIARERKKILKELRKNDKQKKILEDKKKSTPKVVNTKVIFISDDESDDECVVVQEDSEIPDKQTDVIEPEKNNEEVSDDDITYIPPPPIEVINIDDDNGPEFENIISCPLVSSEKNANDIFVRPNNPESSESVSKKNYHPKEHHELLHTPEPSTSNDFLDNTSLEQNSSPNFNFSLHGSDFNNQNDFSVYANPVEYCETESSCSANDPSREINNSVKTIVFDEVDFPRSDIFSENNLESFKTLITPQRRSDSKGRTIKAHLEKSPSKAIENKKSSSDSSSSESDFDQRDFNNALPDLSVMQPSDDTDIQMPSKEKKEKSKKNKKKTIKKKKKKVEHIMESPLQSMKRKKDSTEISVKKKKVLDEAKSTPCSKKKKNNETMKILSNSEKVKKKKKRLLESPLPPKFTENNDAELNDSEINTVQSNDLIIVDSTDQMNLITINEDSSDIEIIAESTVTQQDADTTSNEPNVTPSSETIHNTSVAIVNQLKKFDASFDIQAIQENQSDDPQKWKICDKDENIYCNFDEPGKRGPRCNRCRHFGHYASKCTEKTYPPRCTLCGDDNHKEPRCPKKMCFQCGRKGDYSTNYCWRCFKFRYSICKQCNMPGHLEKLCPDLWRRYHLTRSDASESHFREISHYEDLSQEEISQDKNLATKKIQENTQEQLDKVIQIIPDHCDEKSHDKATAHTDVQKKLYPHPYVDVEDVLSSDTLFDQRNANKAGCLETFDSQNIPNSQSCNLYLDMEDISSNDSIISVGANRIQPLTTVSEHSVSHLRSIPYARSCDSFLDVEDNSSNSAPTSVIKEAEGLKYPQKTVSTSDYQSIFSSIDKQSFDSRYKFPSSYSDFSIPSEDRGVIETSSPVESNEKSIGAGSQLCRQSSDLQNMKNTSKVDVIDSTVISTVESDDEIVEVDDKGGSVGIDRVCQKSPDLQNISDSAETAIIGLDTQISRQFPSSQNFTTNTISVFDTSSTQSNKKIDSQSSDLQIISNSASVANGIADSQIGRQSPDSQNNYTLVDASSNDSIISVVRELCTNLKDSVASRMSPISQIPCSSNSATYPITCESKKSNSGAEGSKNITASTHLSNIDETSDGIIASGSITQKYISSEHLTIMTCGVQIPEQQPSTSSQGYSHSNSSICHQRNQIDFTSDYPQGYFNFKRGSCLSNRAPYWVAPIPKVPGLLAHAAVEISHANQIIPPTHIKITLSNLFDVKEVKIRAIILNGSPEAVVNFLRYELKSLKMKVTDNYINYLTDKLIKCTKVYENNIPITSKVLEEICFWFKRINMFIFGVQEIEIGRAHKLRLKDFVEVNAPQNLNKQMRIELLKSFLYIFGEREKAHVNYFRIMDRIMKNYLTNQKTKGFKRI